MPREPRTGSASDESLPLRCKGLVVGWGGRPLLPAIGCDVRRGRLMVVVGRNGSGKSTWFKTLLGLIPPVRGSVIRQPGVRLAYVPQSAELDPLLPIRVRDIVRMGRLDRRTFWRPWERDTSDIDAALEEAGAADVANARFFELSKGQRQRVLFARMLVSTPDVALLDEPTAAMDAVAETAAMQKLKELSATKSIAIVLISHSKEAADAYADEVLYLNRAEASVALKERRQTSGPDESC